MLIDPLFIDTDERLKGHEILITAMSEKDFYIKVRMLTLIERIEKVKVLKDILIILEKIGV